MLKEINDYPGAAILIAIFIVIVLCLIADVIKPNRCDCQDEDED